MKTLQKTVLAAASLVLFLCLIQCHSSNTRPVPPASWETAPSSPEVASCAHPLASRGSDENRRKAFEALDQSWLLAQSLLEKTPRGVDYPDYLVHFCETASEVGYEKRAQEACQKAFGVGATHFNSSVVMTNSDHDLDCFYAVVEEKAMVAISQRDPCLAMNLLAKMATPDQANCSSKEEIEKLMEQL